MDVPYYERTLASFDDEIVVRPVEGRGLWYAVLDTGFRTQVSDPDFSCGAATREEAIAACARRVRQDAEGIGKFAPHSLLVPGYDVHFRLCRHWTDKERLRELGHDPNDVMADVRRHCAAHGGGWALRGGSIEVEKVSRQFELSFRMAAAGVRAAVEGGTGVDEAAEEAEALMRGRAERSTWARATDATWEILGERIATLREELGPSSPGMRP